MSDDIQNSNENSNEEKIDVKKETKVKEKSKVRMILVLAFIAIVALMTYFQLRGNYLEYTELGENYIDIFNTNLEIKSTIMLISFVIIFFMVYFTNKGIRKGLKPFFDKEQKNLPKLLNKSISLVIAVISSIVISELFMQKVMMFMANTSFGIQDPVMGLDIAYFMFQKPLIELILYCLVSVVLALTIYMALYYIIVFNMFFDGVEGKMLKESNLIKKICRNILYIVIGIATLIIVNTQSIVFGNILKINNTIELIGAGLTESTIQLWGYIIFAFVIVLFSYRAMKNFKKGNTNKVLKNLAVIPAYLVVLFLTMLIFDLAYASTNELDKEKTFIAENINNTKNAYNINIEEANIQNSGTITEQEVNTNKKIINNVPIIPQNVVLKTLQDSQTNIGYHLYNSASIGKYNVDGEDKLVYISPREIKTTGRTYNSKTYEYTHGMGAIISLATSSTDVGTLNYIQKDFTGANQKINISEPRIYFGLETNEMIATNANKIKEYDYTDESGNDKTSTYNGKAGLKLNFLDRIILGISKGNINLAFSSEVTDDSKILMNRDVIERAKKALPYLIYDENPYTVITDSGKMVWVIDGYTTSNCYPYSQYTEIVHDGVKEDINYIRNSVKVLVDAYDGTISYYITDRTDPIAMSYRNIYKTLFVDIDEQIPEDISKHFVYPQYLYDIQSKVLKIYHNVKPDVLYRADDIWDIAKYSTTKSTKSTGTYMNSYYTMVKEEEENRLGLVQMYTPNEKQNIISYLVGSTKNGTNQLKLYKFSSDSNIVGPMQLDKQIEQDEAISKEIESLNVTGTKITKEMIIVPINNTLLYVEPIYQTMLNESDVPKLKKVVVASGNKVAIGDNLLKALENLLSKNAVDIEVENTDDIEGLVDAIIKANNNLTESSVNNNWELMGKDVKKLQDLIISLQKLQEENKKKEQNTTNSITTNSVNQNNVTTNQNTH